MMENEEKRREVAAQMWQALEQVGGLQQAVATLRSEVQPVSETNFAILAEGPLSQIRALQSQVEAYLAIGATERDAPGRRRVQDGDGGDPAVDRPRGDEEGPDPPAPDDQYELALPEHPRRTGGPGRTRTADKQFRKLLLYPPELRGQYFGSVAC